MELDILNDMQSAVTKLPVCKVFEAERNRKNSCLFGRNPNGSVQKKTLKN